MELNLKATYNLTNEQIYALFWNALTSGSIGYGRVKIDAHEDGYYEAKEAVKILNSATPEDYINCNYSICSEDIWTQVFKAGNLLVVEAGEAPSRVTIDDVYHYLNEMQRDEPWILEDFAKGNDDRDTHDAFLQCLLLGRIVYG